jgi:hypothetical protein
VIDGKALFPGDGVNLGFLAAYVLRGWTPDVSKR